MSAESAAVPHDRDATHKLNLCTGFINFLPMYELRISVAIYYYVELPYCNYYNLLTLMKNLKHLHNCTRQCACSIGTSRMTTPTDLTLDPPPTFVV